MKFRKSLIYIIAAVVAIALAVFLFRYFSAQNNAVAESQQQEAVKKVQIVVAARDINPGELITEDMLNTAEILESEQKTIQAVTAPEACLGYSSSVFITKAQPIYSQMLVAPEEIEKTDGLSYEVPKGMVAVAIESQYITSVAGYLKKGDVVNILSDTQSILSAISKEAANYYYVNGKTPDSERKNASQSYLCKNALILAIGDAAYAARNEAIDAGIVSSRTVEKTTTDAQGNSTTETTVDSRGYDYPYVVLAVTDEIARIISQVQKSARLTLTLQPRHDEDSQLIMQGPIIDESYSDIAYEAQTYMYAVPAGTAQGGTAGGNGQTPASPAPTNSVVYG